MGRRAGGEPGRRPHAGTRALRLSGRGAGLPTRHRRVPGAARAPAPPPALPPPRASSLRLACLLRRDPLPGLDLPFPRAPRGAAFSLHRPQPGVVGPSTRAGDVIHSLAEARPSFPSRNQTRRKGVLGPSRVRFAGAVPRPAAPTPRARSLSSHRTASGWLSTDPVTTRRTGKGGWGKEGTERPSELRVGGLGARRGPGAPGWAGAGMLDEQTLRTVQAPGCLLRALSPMSLLVLTGARRGTGFTGAARANAQPATQRPGPAAGPCGVPTAAGARWRGSSRPAGLPGPQGPRAPLNRADNDPRFPRQAFCCLVSLDLCGPSLSQLVPFCHRDKGLPRLVCTCVAFGSFRNALKLVISFVKPLSARLSETSKARGKLAR